MYATRNASRQPTARPNRIPRGTRIHFTSQKIQPQTIAAMRPLKVNPMTIANDLGSHGGSEPRGTSVNGAQQTTQEQSEQDFVHLSRLFLFVL